MSLARRLRASICDTFDSLGALAPTLCEGWRAQDLATHLWLREHRIDALPGVALKPFADHTARVQMATLHSKGFPSLVADLRRPAGMGRIEAISNAEFFIHHVDLSRANDLEVPLTDAEARSLWTGAAVFARRAAARFGGRVVVTPTIGKPLSLGAGDRPVHVCGSPSELLYLFSGRVDHARVEITAEPDAREKFLAGISRL